MKQPKAGEEGFSAIHPVWAMANLEALLHILYFIQEIDDQVLTAHNCSFKK